ncbi:hypothetical protein [Muribaculum intestinale]|uniref:hypothetical protein n=1 Tax=Muribaculum intestinale TaxID=1796646 RepID=UPI0025AEB303|nr:hypothetical protein [Muribaculum intestinale]
MSSKSRRISTICIADDVRFRIEYLKKIKELRASQPDADALITAYPNLPGEDGVVTLAESLYADN